MTALAPAIPGPAAVPARPKYSVLCVDDEPQVLEGLKLNLRRKYDIRTAPNGAEGLIDIQQHGAPAVVISDMRMPGMDGSTFLGRVKEIAPFATRMLLTGQADLESAIAAVNEGQIFRFLTKPCSPAMMLVAVASAAEQHRLVSAERELLEQTLLGSVKTLTDVLSLTSPRMFGRVNRVKQLVADLARSVGLASTWQVEVAAMLSHLGMVSLPAGIAERYFLGRELSAEGQEMVARANRMTDELLGNIPRLEIVRRMLALAIQSGAAVKVPDDPDAAVLGPGAAILRVALEYEALRDRGVDGPGAVREMRTQTFRYDGGVLTALYEVRGHAVGVDRAVEIPVSKLRPGMILDDDLTLTDDTLLAPRGFSVTEGLLGLAANYGGDVKATIRVLVNSEQAAALST